jgi:hypothetical protein
MRREIERYVAILAVLLWALNCYRVFDPITRSLLRSEAMASLMRGCPDDRWAAMMTSRR